MFFASTQANLVVYFSVATVILWVGPGRLVPGYSASLPVAASKQGLARGEVWSSRGGNPFSVWRGLPYAKPPIGDRRFRRPEPLGEEDRWEGEKDFHREMPRCYQLSVVGGFHMGQEDCLFLNVYTPVGSESLLPVMVYIHGGGFVAGEGSSTMYGPHFFMDEGVLLVTVQYRLGIFGFLSTGQDEAPGNLGLWDQREALLWVRDNIAGFGGDPDRVTLFGESAGSMAVNFHLVSPQSRGLFHAAILQSGTALGPYTAPRSPPTFYATKLAEAAGCGDKDTLECLRALPARKLYLHLLLFNSDSCSVRSDLGLTYPGPWIPWEDSSLDQPFLPISPSAGEDAGVPVMMGFNADEGLLYTGRFQKDPSFYTAFMADWETCGAVNFLGRERTSVSAADIERANTLRAAYPDPGQPGLTAMFGDAVFGAGTHQLAKSLVSRGRPVFKYLFAYRGSSSLADIAMGSMWSSTKAFMRGLLRIPGEASGVCHGDELLYLFQVIPILQLLPTASDQAVSRSMVSWWANFAREHRPDPSWTPASKHDELKYWVIGGEGVGEMQERKDLARLEQWL